MPATPPRAGAGRLPRRRIAVASGLLAAGQLLAAPLAAQRSPLELATLPVAGTALRIAYGADSLQFGELRVPAAPGPHPVAIVVHGGCWLDQLEGLDRRAVALDNIRPVAAALAAEGIATWSIEYRRVGHPGGGWPGTFADVAAAADHLRAMASQHRLDLSRVIAVGHSSGAQLALWLAVRDKLFTTSPLHRADPLPLRGVVLLDGPAELGAVLPHQERICRRPVVTELMGGSMTAQQARFRDVSPGAWLPLGVPQLLLQGPTFGAMNAPYVERARRAGDRVDARLVPDAGHFAFIDPATATWSQVVEGIRNLVARPR